MNDDEQRKKLAAEIAQTLGDIDAIVEHTRQQERMAIAQWLTEKAHQSPIESRLLYYLAARDIRNGSYL